MKKQTESVRNSKRNVFALGFVSFFTDISSEMVLSLLSTFIVSLSGSCPALLGLIEGMAEGLSYCKRAISGLFSDKLGKRKNIVLVGYGLSNIIKLLFGVANTTLEALTIRVIDRGEKGVYCRPN